MRNVLRLQVVCVCLVLPDEVRWSPNLSLRKYITKPVQIASNTISVLMIIIIKGNIITKKQRPIQNNALWFYFLRLYHLLCFICDTNKWYEKWDVSFNKSRQELICGNIVFRFIDKNNKNDLCTIFWMRSSSKTNGKMALSMPHNSNPVNWNWDKFSLTCQSCVIRITNTICNLKRNRHLSLSSCFIRLLN